MINLTLKIAGVDRSALVRPGSLRIADTLSSRNTFEVEFWDGTLSPSIRPVVGNTVLLLDTDGVTPLFAGSIDSIDETFVTGALFNYITYQLHCVDYNQVCDRFLVAQAYVNPTQTLSTIVLDIVNTVLLGEGLTTGGVQTGPIIAETKVFNYKTVTQVFNELQTLTGYVWWVDYNKVINFVPRTGVASPFSFDVSNVLSMTASTSRAAGPYRNRQYVRAGTAETSVRTENLNGDGLRRTYNTSYDIERGAVKGQPPSVLLNGAPQTIGIHGIDVGKQFYWIRGVNQIIMDDTGTPLSSADVLSVTYIGRYPSIVVTQSDSEILARATVEGNTGVYESLKTDRNLNDIVAQRNLSNSLILRYGFIPQNVQVVTDTVGIRSGMLIPCSFPTNLVNGNFLVQSVEAHDEQGAFMRYNVSLVNG